MTKLDDEIARIKRDYAYNPNLSQTLIDAATRMYADLAEDEDEPTRKEKATTDQAAADDAWMRRYVLSRNPHTPISQIPQHEWGKAKEMLALTKLSPASEDSGLTGFAGLTMDEAREAVRQMSIVESEPDDYDMGAALAKADAKKAAAERQFARDVLQKPAPEPTERSFPTQGE